METYVQHVWRTSRHAERRLKERIDLLESLLLPPGEADPLQEISMDAEQDVEIELAKVREAFRHADRRSRYRHGEGE
ncbi:MAG: hypothetical protein JO127_12625 [Caulobacteraceae bacterium]|nr:hypothetical protein [Caulobacteraceae bacterium]